MVLSGYDDGSARASGYTLVELMVVVAIFTVLASIAARSFAGRTRSQEAARVARSLQYAVMRARTEAISDGVQRRLNCTATACSLEMAIAVAGAGATPPTPSVGMGAPAAGWVGDGSSISTGTTVQIYAMHNAVELAPTPTPTPALSGNATVTLFPDGSANPPGGGGGGTIFVQDQSGNNKYKIVVFPSTGLARMVTSW